MTYDIETDEYYEEEEERVPGPNEEDFDTYDDYYRAVARYEADQQLVKSGAVGMVEPDQEDFDDYESYYRALSRYQTALAVAEKAQENDSISGAIARGIQAADPAHEEAAKRGFLEKYGEPEDMAVIHEFDALMEERRANEERLHLGNVQGNESEVAAATHLIGEIDAKLADIPLDVPSVKAAKHAEGRHWQENVINKWPNYTDEQKTQFYPDLREAIKWSNQSDADVMITVDPESGDLYQIQCRPEVPCYEMVKRLKSDERNKGIPEESLAYRVQMMGRLGPISGARKITAKKERTAPTKKVQAKGDIEIVTVDGERFDADAMEMKVEKSRVPKPKTHILSRM